MPPAGLSKEQYALWCSDPNLKAAFPFVEQGNQAHLSGMYNFQKAWGEWEKTHPEIIQRAKELAGGLPDKEPVALESSLTEVPETLSALKEIADLCTNLSRAIYKYIELHSETEEETDGVHTPGSGGVVEVGPKSP